MPRSPEADLEASGVHPLVGVGCRITVSVVMSPSPHLPLCDPRELRSAPASLHGRNMGTCLGSLLSSRHGGAGRKMRAM